MFDGGRGGRKAGYSKIKMGPRLWLDKDAWGRNKGRGDSWPLRVPVWKEFYSQDPGLPDRAADESPQGQK